MRTDHAVTSSHGAECGLNDWHTPVKTLPSLRSVIVDCRIHLWGWHHPPPFGKWHSMIDFKRFERNFCPIMLCEPLEYFALFLSFPFCLLTENFLVEFEAKEGRCRNKHDAYQMSYEKSHNSCKKVKLFQSWFFDKATIFVARAMADFQSSLYLYFVFTFSSPTELRKLHKRLSYLIYIPSVLLSWLKISWLLLAFKQLNKRQLMPVGSKIKYIFFTSYC